MRKRARRISYIFEKKKGEELTKGGTETRHPLPFDGTTKEGGGWDLLFL
jgi:hypothetical protein